MSNSFYTPTVIAKEMIRRLEAELIFGGLVNTDYSSEFSYIGASVKVRRPMAYLGQDDNLDITLYTEDITEGTATISMNKTTTIPVVVSALDRTLSFDRWSEMVLKPAAQRLAEKIEASIVANYYKAYWFTGTPGTIPSTFASLADAGAYMTDQNMSQNERIAVHTPASQAKFAADIKATYVTGANRTALENASMGRYAGFDNYASVFAPTHTVGVNTGTPLVNGASQNVTYAASKDTWTQSLITDGWTNSQTAILKAGDVFTLGSVYAVNPSTKVSTGRLQPFVVMTTANSGASTGPATFTISPPIITSGAFQTVDAAPADNAVITVLSGTGATAYRQTLLMDPKAFVLVTRPLDIPQGNGLKTSTQQGNAVTLSVTEFTNGNTLAQTMRFDMLWGTDLLDQRKVMRLTN